MLIMLVQSMTANKEISFKILVSMVIYCWEWYCRWKCLSC